MGMSHGYAHEYIHGYIRGYTHGYSHGYTYGCTHGHTHRYIHQYTHECPLWAARPRPLGMLCSSAPVCAWQCPLWLHGRICSNDDFWQSLVRLFELGILLGSRKRLLALELSQDGYGLKIGSYI